MYDDMKRDVIEQIAPDWDLAHDGVLLCPDGHRVEDDGRCPDGHVSPLRSAGLI